MMNKVDKAIAKILADRKLPDVELVDDSVILDLGFDSIDLAILIADLQDEFGFDPFENGFINFKTVGELKGLFGESE